MMAQPNNPSVSVIGSQFIAPNPLEVKVETNLKGTIWITDVNNTVLLKVKPCDKMSKRQRLLTDANDRPIVMLQEDGWSMHGRWNVYRGASTAKSDMIFTANKKHMNMYRKFRMNVYFANKVTSKDAYDFKIKGEWDKRSCTIYKGHSSTALAQMHTVKKLHTVKLPNDKFSVTIDPNVDYAFVIALITIIDANESPYKNERIAAAESGLGIANSLLDLAGAVAGP